MRPSGKRTSGGDSEQRLSEVKRELCRVWAKSTQSGGNSSNIPKTGNCSGSLRDSKAPRVGGEGVRARVVWNEDREAARREIREDSAGLGQEFA